MRLKFIALSAAFVLPLCSSAGTPPRATINCTDKNPDTVCTEIYSSDYLHRAVMAEAPKAFIVTANYSRMNKKIITVLAAIRNDTDAPIDLAPLASSITLSDGSSVLAADPSPIISKLIRHEQRKLIWKEMAGAAVVGAAQGLGAAGDYTGVDSYGNRTEVYDNDRLGDAVADEAALISERGATMYAKAFTAGKVEPHQTVKGLLYFPLPADSHPTPEYITLQLPSASVRMSVRSSGIDDGKGHETIQRAVSLDSLNGNTREDLAASLNRYFTEIGKGYVKVSATGDHLKTLSFNSSKAGDGLARIKSSLTRNAELLAKLRGVGFETIVITTPDGTATVEL